MKDDAKSLAGMILGREPTAADYGLKDCGLNADWSVSAYHVAGGKLEGIGLYILDNEDGTFSVVERDYHKEDAGEEAIFERTTDSSLYAALENARLFAPSVIRRHREAMRR